MASRPFTTAALAAGIAVVALIAPNTSSAQGAMRLTSTSFGSGQPIPAQFSCEGQGVSPELTWANVPQNAQSLALVVRDPDASQAGFVHWVVYDIPVTTSSLREAAANDAALPDGAYEGTNGKNSKGWVPLCPPKGTHHYHFELYALDGKLPAMNPPTESALENAMHGHVLAKAELVGTYAKSMR